MTNDTLAQIAETLRLQQAQISALSEAVVKLAEAMQICTDLVTRQTKKDP